MKEHLITAFVSSCISVGVVLAVVYTQFETSADIDLKLNDALKEKMAVVTNRKVGTASDDHLGEIDIHEYTLETDSVRAKVLNYGGILNAVEVKTESGWLDVVTGWDTAQGIVNNRRYSGRLVGRYANRIAKGKFEIDGVEYTLFLNNGGPNSNANSLHGGEFGFDRKMWDVKVVENGVELSYVSEDMEEGYPGKLTVQVTYTLKGGSLQIEYKATTTKKTVVNLTNHVYFNLDGHENWGDLRNQTIVLLADHYTPADDESIPTGEIRNVTGTTFDLRKPVRLNKETLAAADEVVGGYDHNFCVKLHNSVEMKDLAIAKSETSGISLKVRGTQPGVQFYTSQFLNGKGGKHGNNYEEQTAFCLETQHYPDSPNQPNFPSTLLAPDNEYREVSQFVFST